MNKKTLWIAQTGILLALLICLQWLGSFIPVPMAKQLVTGSFVNCVLAVTALFAGLWSGITLAVISPVLAYSLGIAPNLLTVPVIIVGNSLYVILLFILAGKRSSYLRQILAWIIAAVAKFAVMYAAVKWLICGLLAEEFLSSGILKMPMLTALPATFFWPQLITALIGGAIGLLIAPTLRKTLHKS